MGKKRKTQTKTLAEMKGDLVDLQVEKTLLGDTDNLTGRIRASKACIRAREFRSGIARVVLTGFAVCICLSCSGCFEETGRGAANLVRGVGSLIGGVCQDVGNGIDDLSE